MKALLWAGGLFAALWYAQARGWIAGTHWQAVTLCAALWVAWPFMRAYKKLFEAARNARALRQSAENK
jgi:hypothetical protein